MIDGETGGVCGRLLVGFTKEFDVGRSSRESLPIIKSPICGMQGIRVAISEEGNIGPNKQARLVLFEIL